MRETKKPGAPKATPKPSQKTQRERFVEFAREHGADDPKALDKALGEIEDARDSAKKSKRP